MSKNWIRVAKIIVEGSAGALDLSPFRCRFKIKQFTSESPNLADIRITNLAPSTVKKFIEKEFKKVTVIAGYESNSGVIFTGDIVQARSGRETPTDTYLDIFARDGEYWHNYATVNKTFAAGSTMKDHYDEAMKSFKKFGAVEGFLGIDLSKKKYPRAVTLYGMARDVMRNIATSMNASWSTQQGEVHMLGVKQMMPGSAVILNSSTGLIGMPTQEIGGVMATCLINPNLKINSKVKIDQGSINMAQLVRDRGGEVENAQNSKLPSIAADGMYKILQIDVEGDTRGSPWYMYLACVAASGEGYLPDNLRAASGDYQGTV